MIDWNKTFKETGYNKNYFDKYPGSSKIKICRICDECYKINWIIFSQRFDLCNSCSHKGENNPFYNKKHSDEHKNNIRKLNQGKLNGNYGRKHTKEEREKISNNRIYLLGKDNPCFGIKHSREHNIKSSCTKQGISRENWDGFVSIGEYDENFNLSLKQLIRNKYNNCDYISGIHKSICNTNRELDIHHINYNKQNSDENNLIPLSKSNHVRTNSNRPFWNKLFIYSSEIDKWYYEVE